MRPALLLVICALASACKREPTFDERYAATQKRIEAQSRQLDAELTGSPRPSGEADPTRDRSEQPRD